MVVLVVPTASVSICRAIHQRHEPDAPTLVFCEVALGTLRVPVIEGFAIVRYTEGVRALGAWANLETFATLFLLGQILAKERG